MEERLISLETRVAYQENMLEELNKIIFRQEEQIEKLRHTVVKLHEKYAALSTSTVGDISEESPPPHY